MGRVRLRLAQGFPYVVAAAVGVWADRPFGWRVAVVLAAVAAVAVLVVIRPSVVRLRRRVEGTQPVPRVVGLPLADAKAALAAAGFSVVHHDGDVRPGAPEGVVVSQRPRAGESITAGSRVWLTTSRPGAVQPGAGTVT